MRSVVRAAAAVVLLGVTGAAVRAEAGLASIFQDRMVLQRDKPVAVWGTADAGAKVAVLFGGQTKEAVADGTGKWKVMLDAMPASREGRVLEMTSGGKTVACKEVLVGEVWVTAGQSNMVAGGPDVDFGVYPRYVSPGTKESGAEIRMVRFGAGAASLEPQSDVASMYRGKDGDSWQTLAEDKLPAENGIPVYMARVLRDGLDVPVGVIQIAVPGTNQGAWMSKETLEKFPGEGGRNFYEEMLAETREKASKGAIKTLEQFQKSSWLEQRRNFLPFANFPTALYNTRVHPLAPLAIRGVMWHQGEAGPTGPYGERLVAMVKQWRELFGQDFHFIWGTLSRNTTDGPPLSPMRAGFYRSNNNVEIRKALELFGPEGKATLVEFYDNGNNVTHWLAKAESGRRMGLAALTEVYGQKHVYTGPRMVETKIEGNKATVKFVHVGEGLMYEPSIEGISGVYVRGKDGTVRWGEVKVVGKDAIEVSHPDVKAIETVAYADNPNPHETIFNSEKLPASPFATNPTREKDTKGSVALLSKVGGGPAKPEWHVAHVRRSGYVFSVAKGTTVKAYVPKEWNGVEVESGGKAIAVKEVAEGGAKFVTFEAPGEGWIIVAEKGKAEGFRGVNRI